MPSQRSHGYADESSSTTLPASPSPSPASPLAPKTPVKLRPPAHVAPHPLEEASAAARTASTPGPQKPQEEPSPGLRNAAGEELPKRETTPETNRTSATTPAESAAHTASPRRSKSDRSQLSFESDEALASDNAENSLLQTRGLIKIYDGRTVVNGVDIHVRPGEIVGLLGPNGAGKTTTLRVLATLLKPDAGTAKVAGFDVVEDAEAVRSRIGVVNGGMGLYDRLTGREILRYFGRLYGMDAAAVDARIERLDDLLSLGDTLDRRAGGFSTGMKQKVVIARAVIHDPPVIFFDEATSGLDVVARRNVIDFVKAYPSEGRAVVYSTHVMSEVEELCDRCSIIYQGRKIAEGTVAELTGLTEAANLEEAFFKLVTRSGLSAAEVAA